MEQKKLRETIWQRVVLDLNNQSQIQVHCALLSPPITYWPLQSPKTTSLYICDCVSVTLKINHTHCCHATLAAHKTHRYNWLHCTLYPLWTGQLANENNSAVTGREPNPWPCLSDNQAWQIISKKKWGRREDKRTVSVRQERNLGWKETRWNKILFIVCYGRPRVMTVWLWADGKPPDDNTHTITPHKHTGRSGWKEDLLFHNDHSEGHNHVISPTSKVEEAQSLVFRDLQESRGRLCEGIAQWEKDKQKAPKRVRACIKMWLYEVCVCVRGGD